MVSWVAARQGKNGGCQPWSGSQGGALSRGSARFLTDVGIFTDVRNCGQRSSSSTLPASLSHCRVIPACGVPATSPCPGALCPLSACALLPLQVVRTAKAALMRPDPGFQSEHMQRQPPDPRPARSMLWDVPPLLNPNPNTPCDSVDSSSTGSLAGGPQQPPDPLQLDSAPLASIRLELPPCLPAKHVVAWEAVAPGGTTAPPSTLLLLPLPQPAGAQGPGSSANPTLPPPPAAPLVPSAVVTPWPVWGSSPPQQKQQPTAAPSSPPVPPPPQPGGGTAPVVGDTWQLQPGGLAAMAGGNAATYNVLVSACGACGTAV